MIIWFWTDRELYGRLSGTVSQKLDVHLDENRYVMSQDFDAVQTRGCDVEQSQCRFFSNQT